MHTLGCHEETIFGFHVGDPNTYSDHCPLELQLKCGNNSLLELINITKNSVEDLLYQFLPAENPDALTNHLGQFKVAGYRVGVSNASRLKRTKRIIYI